MDQMNCFVITCIRCGTHSFNWNTFCTVYNCLTCKIYIHDKGNSKLLHCTTQGSRMLYALSIPCNPTCFNSSLNLPRLMCPRQILHSNCLQSPPIRDILDLSALQPLHNTIVHVSSNLEIPIHWNSNNFKDHWKCTICTIEECLDCTIRQWFESV